MSGVTSFLLLLGATAATQAAPQHAARTNKFEFAHSKVERFSLHAETEIEWNGRTPYVSSVICHGENGDVSFSVDRSRRISWLRLNFRGDEDDDGERGEPTLLGDTLWLFVDGRKYEFRNIPLGSNRFGNATYPDSPPGPMVIPWRGYQAVRPANESLFVNISFVHGAILDAKQVQWSFRSRDWTRVDRAEPENALPEGWATKRYSVDVRGLKAAVAWCIEAVTTPAATTLPPAILNGTMN